MRLKIPTPAWKKRNIGDLTVYEASTMAWLPRIVQGFTTRHGGVSRPPYDSLNLGAHVGDESDAVGANRERLWSDLGFRESRVVTAEQVHGDRVAVVDSPASGPIEGVDALVTGTPGLLLTMFFADCAPVYIVDPTKRVIGLAHAGWRGTSKNIVRNTILRMADTFDCCPTSMLVAVGPCISSESYEVGTEVADLFRDLSVGRASGAAIAVHPYNEMTGTYCLDLRQIIFAQCLDAGIRAEYVAVCGDDTYRNRRDFFSYRRDGRTGRHAGYLALREE